MSLKLRVDAEHPLLPKLMKCHKTTIRVFIEIEGVLKPYVVDRFDYEHHTCCCGGQDFWVGTAHLRPGDDPWWALGLGPP